MGDAVDSSPRLPLALDASRSGVLPGRRASLRAGPARSKNGCASVRRRFEVPVLKSLNFEKHRPKVICVETLVAATTRQKLEAVELLIDKGYVARGATFANTIMVDKRLLG